MTLELYLLIVPVSALMLATATYVITGWLDKKSRKSQKQAEKRST